jgi:hypothetical protein
MCCVQVRLGVRIIVTVVSTLCILLLADICMPFSGKRNREHSVLKMQANDSKILMVLICACAYCVCVVMIFSCL